MTEQTKPEKTKGSTVKPEDDRIEVSQQGRAQGNLQRDVATQDEEKRATETPAGVTRVTGQDKRNHGESA